MQELGARLWDQPFAWSNYSKKILQKFISPHILKPGCELRGTFTAAWISVHSGKKKKNNKDKKNAPPRRWQKTSIVNQELWEQPGLHKAFDFFTHSVSSDQPGIIHIHNVSKWINHVEMDLGRHLAQKKVLALSWVHFCPVFRLSGWPLSHLKFEFVSAVQWNWKHQSAGWFKSAVKFNCWWIIFIFEVGLALIRSFFK